MNNEYEVIHQEFGYQPLAGYLMNVIDLCRDKDGLDTIAFLKNIERYVVAIEKESERNNFELKEFFFAISTDENCFGMDFYVGYTIAELKLFKGSYADTNYYRMFTKYEDWGLDEIQLVDGTETEKENKEMELRVATNLINITRTFDNLYKNGKVKDSDGMEMEFLKIANEGEILLMDSYIEERLLEIFHLEEEYDLVEVEVSRVREVLEKAVVKVAVSKSFGGDARREAEHYIENSFTEESNLDWEVEEEEYEFEDLVVGDSEITDTDTLDNLDYVELNAILD